MSDVEVRIAALRVYPVKSCAGIALSQSLLLETGFDLDRHWMLVDTAGSFVTQRELPRMALIRPTLKTYEVVLRAPGMLALHLAVDAVEAPCRVRVWKDEVAAYDMGDLAAQWFSDFLGQRLRLVRFDPEQRRLSNLQWTGGIEAENAFSDGYPILVTTQASIDELNRKIGTPVTMERFRPNLVLDGLDAHGEDHLDEIRFDTPQGPVILKLVKPCSRCTIPDVDPETAESGHAVADALATYRADPRLDGAITFGMNAVIVEGIERELRVGMAGGATYKF
ncbi:MAG TPA: MOSC N-terminal beta barrel domain-containing protein [Albitalea sp.]|nr:MOSC N-terminal beta barrel domain-containing protein [Albitalea sp.]